MLSYIQKWTIDNQLPGSFSQWKVVFCAESLLFQACVFKCVCAGVVPGTVQAVHAHYFYRSTWCIFQLIDRMFWHVNIRLHTASLFTISLWSYTDVLHRQCLGQQVFKLLVFANCHPAHSTAEQIEAFAYLNTAMLKPWQFKSIRTYNIHHSLTSSSTYSHYNCWKVKRKITFILLQLVLPLMSMVFWHNLPT